LLFSRKDTRNLAYDWVKNNLNDKEDFLFVIGEDLETISFQNNLTKRVQKICLIADRLKYSHGAVAFLGQTLPERY
jgi:hypothetical protein